LFSVNAADGPALGTATPLQNVLNAMPAIPIAGNNLKFQFGGDIWIATVNGENFSAGTIVVEDTDTGSILTLKQTHIWPGAVGKTAGRVANVIPGGGAVGGALNAAGTIAGAAGAIEAAGPEIVLEYKAGPPARLSFVSITSPEGTSSDAPPMENWYKYDLDGFSVYAFSLNFIVTYPWGMSIIFPDFFPLYIFPLIPIPTITWTIYEKYKPNWFFIPSYFLSGKVHTFFGNMIYDNETTDVYGIVLDLSPGVLFKHRFPKDRVLWNLGASLDFMWFFNFEGLSEEYEVEYWWNDGNGVQERRTYTNSVQYSRGFSFLLGMGIQTGFSFRVDPYVSLDLNGVLKFPFGTLDMTRDDLRISKLLSDMPPKSKSYWPFHGAIELGVTAWFPYKNRKQK